MKISLNDTAYPYVPSARRYLEAEHGANIDDYAEDVKNSAAEIKIEWECDLEGVTSYEVEYSTSPDFSDKKTVSVDAAGRSVGLYNLYKATEYYVRVSALCGAERLDFCDASFRTTELGPRVMQVDGIYNVRDMGGYMTESGRVTVQGMLYRGGSLTPADIYDPNITDEGKRTMSEEMGIKTEIDFRTPKESGIEGEVSLIPGATLKYLNIGAYTEFNERKEYREIFSAFSDINNYPIYFHCTGGADRTGTVAFLVNALLGVPLTILIKDYEFTSFSVYGVRNSQYGVYSTTFKPFFETLNSYEGSSLSQKTENYMLSIGVTQNEIDNIKAIMFGEITK